MRRSRGKGKGKGGRGREGWHLGDLEIEEKEGEEGSGKGKGENHRELRKGKRPFQQMITYIFGLSIQMPLFPLAFVQVYWVQPSL